MGGLSWWHWVIIIGVFIVIFGSKRLPDAARGVGRSLRILKSEVSAMQEDDGKAKKPAETDTSASVPTPTAQITGAPTAPPAPPPPASSSVPVVNGVPVEEHRT